jgi:hypothetical protein
MSNYYQDLRTFKHFFVHLCHPIKRYEANKIWGQWLIRSLSSVQHAYLPLPPEESCDQILRDHMVEKGADLPWATSVVNTLQNELHRLGELYLHAKLAQHTPGQYPLNSEVGYETYTQRHTYHVYYYGQMYIRFDDRTYRQLSQRYIGPPEYRHFLFFEMGFNYHILDGHSFQWAVPPKVLSHLRKYNNLQYELFASPLNVQMKCYYSLFYVDRYFGSLGNFFYSSPATYDDGLYEINPPFIEKLFIDSSTRLLTLLEQRQAAHRALVFLYVMPDWTDSEGYTQLRQCPYFHEEIILPTDRHFYYNAMQNRMVRVNFDTHLLIVGTTAGLAQDWSQLTRNKVIEHFTHF